MASARSLAYHQLFERATDSDRLSGFNIFMVGVILLAVVFAIASTEADIANPNRALFIWIEFGFGVVFGVEYVARIWAIAEEAEDGKLWRRRLRYMLTPMALIDLVVVLASLAPFFVSDVAILRLVRLFRLAALAKFGRFSRAFQELASAIADRKYELFVTMCLAGMLLLFGATALYWAERDVQPEDFGSIPRALWWAIITLTTVGYGDVSPVTPVGKFLASLVALGGIGLVAMPTGIMASAFSDAMQARRDREAEEAAEAERKAER